MPQHNNKKKTPKELNDTFWNSNAGRLARIDRPIQAVYPEFAILSGIKGANFNTINKASRTLIKEPFKKKERFDLRKGLDQPSEARKALGLELLKIFSPFRNGGKIKLSDANYYSIMERVAKDNWKQWGDESEDAALTRILNANDYDYRGYYNKYPNSRANADTHWTDEFKLPRHSTFSNESKYSGIVSDYNPKGIRGGMWDGNNFIPSIEQINYNNTLNNMARINSRLACGGKRKLACGGRSRYACGGNRPQAGWGALVAPVVGGAINFIGGWLQAKSQKDAWEEQQKAQEELMRQQNLLNQQQTAANSLNNYAQAEAYNANQDLQNDELVYRCGGRKKARNGRSTRLSSPYITDGGVAIPLGNGLTLLRGATHEDTNETGQTGIGIQVGRHQIEAENGEVAQKKNKELRIFSDQPMFNGVSPADAVQAGYNPDEIFAAQEVYKKMVGLKDDGSSYKCGGRKKAASGLLDYYDDVQENDATRTWASSYNGRGRATRYGDNLDFISALIAAAGADAINGIAGDGDEQSALDVWFDNLVGRSPNANNIYTIQARGGMPSLASAIRGLRNIGRGLSGRSTSLSNRLVDPRFKFTGKSGREYSLDEANEITRRVFERGLPNKNNSLPNKPQTSTTKSIGYSSEPQINYGEIASNAVTGARGQSYRVNSNGRLEVNNSGYIPGGTSTRQANPRSGVNTSATRPTNIPYEQRLTPYNNSFGNRTRSAVYNASTRLSRALDDIVHKYRVKKRANSINKARQQKENANTNNNTNNANQTKWQKKWQTTKRRSIKGLKGAAAVGAAIGGISAIRTLTNDEEINTNGNSTPTPKQNNQPRRNQQAATQSTQKATPTNNSTNTSTTTPSKSKANASRPAKKRSNNNAQKRQARLRDVARFTAPTSETRRATQRNIDISNFTPEQIDRLKEEITQMPSDRRLTRDESIRLTGILNRIDYLNSKRNRDKKRFGGSSITTPVERIGRRKYPLGGNSVYTGYSFKFTPNSYGGESPQLVTEEPLKIWQRYAAAANDPGSIASDISQGITPQSVPSRSGNNYLNNPYWGNNRSGLMVKDADWIGLGTDILGSLGIGLINNATLKDINYDYTLPQYVDETPVAFDTIWHNGAQRANVERNRINARNIIGRNTASANTAVQRMQESDTNAMMQQNVLWDEKANKEAELRNAAAQNEQQVRARNAAARNNYYQQVANIRNREIDQNNAIKAQRGQAWASSLAGLGQAASNFLAQAGQRYEDNQALRALSAARGAIMPSMLGAGVDYDNNTIAGLIWNAQQNLNQDIVKPDRKDYGSDDAYSTALKDYENKMKQREQDQNFVNLGTSILGSRGRSGRRYLRSLGLY